MFLTKFAVNRPVTTTMLFVALVFFGISAYSKLGVNTLPDVKPPVVIINTILPGASPEEIETEVTNKIEKEVSGINNVKEIKSYSMESISMLIINFDLKKDGDKAINEVKEKMDLVLPELPSNIKRPIIQKYNPTDEPVLNVVLSGDISGKILYDIAEKELKNEFLQIEGVSKIDITGGEKREIKILADKRRLVELGLNFNDINQSIGASNVKVPAGNYNLEHRQFSVEAGEKFSSLEDIRNMFIPYDGNMLMLKDLAEVRDSVKRVKTRSTFFDVKGNQYFPNVVSMSIRKMSDANAVHLAEEIHAKIKELESTLPEGVKMSTPFDWSVYTKSSVDDAIMNVVLGVLLTGLILMFFLGDIRTVLIVSISIPVSLIATFAVMKQINASLNMMTLMSFAVAIGALISNSIVVIENILRLLKEGKPIKEATIEGTSEVVLAVISSTGTNLVVFLPIASMTTVAGAYFKEYALTISAATIFSLLVSFTLTPMLASVLFRKEKKKSRFANLMDSLFSRLENRYENILKKLISRKWKPLVLFVSMLILFFLSTKILNLVGFNFLPKDDSGALVVECELPAGSNLKENARIIRQIEKKITVHPEVIACLSSLGLKNSNMQGVNFAKIDVKLCSSSKREISNYELVEVLTDELNEFSDVISFVSTEGSDEGMPISFVIQSISSDDLKEANSLLKDRLSELDGIAGFESSFREGNQPIHLKPKKDVLAKLGMNTYELAMTVRAAINGVKAGVYKELGKEYDISLSFHEDEVNSLEKIRQIPINFNEIAYTIGQLVDISYKTSQAQIFHVNKKKTIEFGFFPEDHVSEMDAQDQILELVNSLDLPSSVEFEWSGNTKEMKKTNTDFIITLIIALLLLYMLLASLLENFWHPFILFTTVPMAMIGVFILLFISGSSMNIMALVAMITLIGLAVNDSILIYDYNTQLVNKGRTIYEATLEAGKTKLKAVIMTSVAIVIGMLPNALGIGDAGAAYRTPMAIVTIGGIITSTVLTLFVIPSIFYVIKSRCKK